jgi:hypothetical protein
MKEVSQRSLPGEATARNAAHMYSATRASSFAIVSVDLGLRKIEAEAEFSDVRV